LNTSLKLTGPSLAEKILQAECECQWHSGWQYMISVDVQLASDPRLQLEVEGEGERRGPMGLGA
jgi:hypothetical protein